MNAWVEWLVDIGYPFGVNFATVPPVELMDLAHAYAMMHGDDLTADDWYSAIMREINQPTGVVIDSQPAAVGDDMTAVVDATSEIEERLASVLPFRGRGD